MVRAVCALQIGYIRHGWHCSIRIYTNRWRRGRGTDAQKTWHLDSNRYCLLFICVVSFIFFFPLLFCRATLTICARAHCRGFGLRAILTLHVTSHRTLKSPKKWKMKKRIRRWRHVSGRKVSFCTSQERIREKSHGNDKFIVQHWMRHRRFCPFLW